MGEDVVVHLQ
jgi:hypothetical protein